MKKKIKDGYERFLEMEDYQVERASTRAALDAIHRARRFGTDIIIEDDGRVKSLKPNETAPYEKQLIEEVERLNRKIAELQAQQPNALSLNETPGKSQK